MDVGTGPNLDPSASAGSVRQVVGVSPTRKRAARAPSNESSESWIFAIRSAVVSTSGPETSSYGKTPPRPPHPLAGYGILFEVLADCAPGGVECYAVAVGCGRELPGLVVCLLI